MNICGVTTVGIGIASCASRSAVSTWVSISSIAVSILRCEDAVTRPRVAAILLAVSNVPNGVAMIGSRWFSPDTSLAIARMQFEAAVEDDARQRRKAFCGMGADDREHDV